MDGVEVTYRRKKDIFDPSIYDDIFTWKTAQIRLQYLPHSKELYIENFSNDTSDEKDKGNGKKLLCYAILELQKKYECNMVTLFPDTSKYPQINQQAKLKDYYRTKYGFEKIPGKEYLRATPETILAHCSGGGYSEK